MYKHAENVGLRILRSGVIWNMYCDDVVGCRIVVLLPQHEEVLDHEDWHENVNVR